MTKSTFLFLLVIVVGTAYAVPYYDPSGPNLPGCSTAPDGFCFNRFFDISKPIISQLMTTAQFAFIIGNNAMRFACVSVLSPPNAIKEHILRGTIKRPVSEHTFLNINTMLVQIDYRTRVHWFPGQEHVWLPLMNEFGLSTSDKVAADDGNAVHLANLIFERFLEIVERDGLNAFGNIGPHGEVIDYHQVNFTDYTGYEPVNKWNQIRDPDHWQPAYTAPRNNTQMLDVAFGSSNRLGPRIQAYDTPQLACWEHNLLTPREADSITFPPFTDTFKHNSDAYERNIKEVIDASANLTDRQKMFAEWFETKIYSFPLLSGPVVRRMAPGDLLFNVVNGYYYNSVVMSAAAITWRAKTQYDAPRPFTMAEAAFGNQVVRAWGGKGRGTVTMRAREFQSYLPNGAHPEYPSGTTCLCAALAEAVRIIGNGSDILGSAVTFPAGSSSIEPNITPVTSVFTRFNTITEYLDLCANSRVWAGVHIRPSLQASLDTCPQIARLARPNFERMMAGDLSWYDNARPVHIEGCRRR